MFYILGGFLNSDRLISLIERLLTSQLCKLCLSLTKIRFVNHILSFLNHILSQSPKKLEESEILEISFLKKFLRELMVAL